MYDNLILRWLQGDKNCWKVGRRLKSFVYFINLVFTVLCLLHIIINFYVTLYPPNPDIKVYDKALKDVPFPILFKLCGKEIHNSSKRYGMFGYKNELPLFSGKSKYSKHVFGWNGHTESGSTIGTVSGKLILSNVKTSSY